ncbi:class I SAM-dependent methyltransferase [Amycolatopsis sp. NPDC051372]|uniref:class I SAM-dependent methyltransferase n=1 Tax=Amycolatopsis sp. NPDC051372 TaxID=3155669 RepID=UPI00342B17A9
MSAHTHDHIDWADRLTQLRTADALDANALSAIARRLVAALPPTPTIVDLGCGAGGMSTHFARALATHGGGTLVLVDATPELLAEAEKSVRGSRRHRLEQRRCGRCADRARRRCGHWFGRTPAGAGRPHGRWLHRWGLRYRCGRCADRARRRCGHWFGRAPAGAG